MATRYRITKIDNDNNPKIEELYTFGFNSPKSIFNIPLLKKKLSKMEVGEYYEITIP